MNRPITMTPRTIPVRAATLGRHPRFLSHSEPGLQASVMMSAIRSGPIMGAATRMPASTATVLAAVMSNRLNGAKSPGPAVSDRRSPTSGGPFSSLALAPRGSVIGKNVRQALADPQSFPFLSLLIPPTLQEPLTARRITINPDERSILGDTAEVLAREWRFPLLAGYAIGARGGLHENPRVGVAIPDGQVVVTPARRFHSDAARLGEELQRELRIRTCLLEHVCARGMPGLLDLPARALLHQRVTAVRWNDYHCTLVVEKLRDGFLGCACSREAAIEDVTLSLHLACHRFHAQSYSGDSVGQLDAIQVRADETHPRLPARGRARRADEVLVCRSIGEREDERHLARAQSLRRESGRYVVHQRVDHEHQALGIGERVIHPVHR